MIVTAPSLENLTMTIAQEIHVRASLEATFDALLEQMGPANEKPDGTPLPMTIEAWPGGRWFRDLGQGNGHFWGSVQAIKRPTLLEITGPLFMSAPVINNVQYRLTEVDGGTLMAFRHSAFGFIPDDYKSGLTQGWTPLFERIRKHAEATRRVQIGDRIMADASTALLQELEQEAQRPRGASSSACRQIDSRWKPHDKSMSLGQLALHVATVPGAIAEISQQSPFPRAVVRPAERRRARRSWCRRWSRASRRRKDDPRRAWTTQ